MPPCIPTHTHTYTHKPSHFSAATVGAFQHTNAHGQVVKAHSVKNYAPNPSRAVSEHRKKQQKLCEEEKSTLLCLQVCEALKRKIKQGGTERTFENNGTPILQLYCHYACFVVTANHGDHTEKNKAFLSASESFLQKQTND